MTLKLGFHQSDTELSILDFAVVAAFAAAAVAVWAAWEMRVSFFQSRWDSPKTTALVLFAVAAVLDSPWRLLSEQSLPLAGRYYFLAAVGHLCYLAACAAGLKYIYLRLLPDEATGLLMRRRIVPLVMIAVAILAVSFSATPLTASLSADHLYLVRPDGWLTIYWFTFYGALTLMLLAGMYGLNRLRADPRSVKLGLLLTALAMGVLASVLRMVGLVIGYPESVGVYAWSLGHGAIAVGAVAVVQSWRHRLSAMMRPDGDSV